MEALTKELPDTPDQTRGILNVIGRRRFLFQLILGKRATTPHGTFQFGFPRILLETVNRKFKTSRKVALLIKANDFVNIP